MVGLIIRLEIILWSANLYHVIFAKRCFYNTRWRKKCRNCLHIHLLFSKTTFNTPLCFVHARCEHHWTELVRLPCNSCVPCMVILGSRKNLTRHCFMRARCKEHWIELFRALCNLCVSESQATREALSLCLILTNRVLHCITYGKSKQLEHFKRSEHFAAMFVFSHKECIETLSLFWSKKLE